MNWASSPVCRAAAQSGLRTVDGTGMLVHQGAVAFEAWTGQEAPVAAMRRLPRSRGRPCPGAHPRVLEPRWVSPSIHCRTPRRADSASLSVRIHKATENGALSMSRVAELTRCLKMRCRWPGKRYRLHDRLRLRALTCLFLYAHHFANASSGDASDFIVQEPARVGCDAGGAAVAADAQNCS